MITIKKSFIGFFIGLILSLVGFILQFRSISVTRLIANRNFNGISFDQFHMINDSVISIGSNLFLVGCFLILIEYSFIKLSKIRKDDKS